MNKLYILICAIVLSGCNRSTVTAEQVSKAEAYCKKNNSDVIVGHSVFDNGNFKEVRSVSCGRNGYSFTIPKEALK